MEILLHSSGWLLSIATALGNGVVVFLVAKNHHLHSAPANKFVLSLAVADFGVGIAVFPSSYFCNKYSMACNSRVYMAFFWFFLHSSGWFLEKQHSSLTNFQSLFIRATGHTSPLSLECKLVETDMYTRLFQMFLSISSLICFEIMCRFMITDKTCRCCWLKLWMD